MSICYPIRYKFQSEATLYGIQYEKHALKQVESEFQQNHINCELVSCGLFRHSKYPFLGATPDGLLNCDCCTGYVVEVKCPYKCRNADILELIETDKQFCLTRIDSNFFLKKNHPYFYQIQLQMFLTNRRKCIFAVWSPRLMITEIIDVDIEFLKEKLSVAESFFKYAVLPELTAKWYSRDNETNYSQENENGH